MKYDILAGAYRELEGTSKRLKKTYIISELLKITKEEELEKIILLLQGRVFPITDNREIGIASKLVVKAIAIASGFPTSVIEENWRKKGDLGLVAEELMSKKQQNLLFTEELTVKSVFDNLRKLATFEGKGSVDFKLKTIAKILSQANALEARYVVRAALQELRVGVAEGTLRDAIAWAYLEGINPNYDDEKIAIEPENREEYTTKINAIQDALNKTNNFTTVAIATKKGLDELAKLRLIPGFPIKVMLAQKVTTAKEGFETVGKPAALEYKYDGFRMQIHKANGEVKIFTRRLEEVTKQFPEVKKIVNDNIKANSFIIDCEAAGYDSKTGKYTPFQSISQRIKRKYDIEKVAKEFPVELNVFDIIFVDGAEILNKPFKERRAILEKIIISKEKEIKISKMIITSDEEEATKFFDASVKAGNEGLMLKNLDGIYKPGGRVGHMIKWKSSMDPIDVAIVGAEWGEGKRSGWLTSFTVAIQEEGEFLEIGKVGTGLKEKREEGLSFDELTELLKPHIIKQVGRDVSIEPNIVVSLLFDEIQKSPSYSSGFALRFPRFVNLREDRSPDDVATINEIENLFYNQKKT